MTITEIIQNLIGTPDYFEVVTVNSIEEVVKTFDLQYITASILLIMTVYVIYNILLSMVKSMGGRK